MKLFKVNYNFLDDKENVVGEDSVYVYSDNELLAMESSLSMASQFALKPFYKSIETMPVGTMIMMANMVAIPTTEEKPLVSLIGDGGKAVN